MSEIAQEVARMDEERLLTKFVDAFMEKATDPRVELTLTDDDPDAEILRDPNDSTLKVALRIFSMAGDTTREQFQQGSKIVKGGEVVDIRLDSGAIARFVFESCASLTDSSEYQVIYRAQV